jgi:putative proteasome-type protease
LSENDHFALPRAAAGVHSAHFEQAWLAMTYCVGIQVHDGLVMVSDSRTNAGVDQVSTYSKLWSLGVPGERQFMICSAGNLATTQAVLNEVKRHAKEGLETSLMTVASLSEAAAYLGSLSVEEQKKHAAAAEDSGGLFSSSFIIAGEVAGAEAGLYMVYPEGNYIPSSAQAPFLQIGETKYGKPILDRVISSGTDLNHAALCALVSMDATMRSNLSVGPPIELTIYRSGSLQPGRYTSFAEDSEYFRLISKTWDQLMKESFDRLPPIPGGDGDT